MGYRSDTIAISRDMGPLSLQVHQKEPRVFFVFATNRGFKETLSPCRLWFPSLTTFFRGPKPLKIPKYQKTPRLHELFVNFCLLPCDTSQEHNGNYSEKKNLFRWTFLFWVDFFRWIFLFGPWYAGVQNVWGEENVPENALSRKVLDPSKRASGLLCRGSLYRKNREHWHLRGGSKNPFLGGVSFVRFSTPLFFPPAPHSVLWPQILKYCPHRNDYNWNSWQIKTCNCKCNFCKMNSSWNSEL